MSTLKPQELKSEENKIKGIALKATTNINSLIKDFFKIPPSYKALITLSFKQSKPAAAVAHKPIPATSRPVIAEVVDAPASDEGASTTPTARKRALITAPEGVSEAKKERTFYAPPAGKFSGDNSFRRYSGAGHVRGRGNGRGFSRGGRGDFASRRRYTSRY